MDWRSLLNGRIAGLPLQSDAGLPGCNQRATEYDRQQFLGTLQLLPVAFQL